MNRRLAQIAVLLAALVACHRPACADGHDFSTRELIEALSHTEPQVRQGAAGALAEAPGETGKTVPALLNALRSDRDESVRASLRSALVAIGSRSVPHLVQSLRDWPADRRRELVMLLAVIGPKAVAAVPELQALESSHDEQLSKCAAFALSCIQTGDKPQPGREAPAGKIEPAHAEAPRDDEGASAEPRVPLRHALYEVVGEPAQRTTRKAVPLRPPTGQPGPSIVQRLDREWSAMAATFRDCWQAHGEGISLALRYVGIGYAAWLLLYCATPLWFLRLDRLMQHRPRNFFARLLTCWSGPLRGLLLLPWLSRGRPVVSDWLGARADDVIGRFWMQDFARAHATFVNAPVLLNGELRGELSPRDLRFLSRKGAVVHVTGPSGSGKTALALEIAGLALGRWLSGRRLLPVYLRPAPDMNISQIISEQVRALLGIEPAERPFLDPLLKSIERRRTLLIVDTYDDNDDARDFIDRVRAAAAGRPLVIVSSDRHLVAALSPIIRVEPVSPAECEVVLAGKFVDDYLQRFGYGDHVSDDERRRLLEHIVSLGAARPMPMLFLKICLDDFLHAKAGGFDWSPARSSGELVSRHVDRQLAGARGCGFTHAELRRDVGELARMSVAKAFRPQTVRRDAALKNLPGWNAPHRLRVIEDKLQLIETERGETPGVRFQSSLLAVNVAAEARRATLDLGGNRWSSFLRQLRQAAQSTAGVEPFALALYDCCVSSTAQRPAFVLADLGEIAGLGTEQIERDLLEHQLAAALARFDDADPGARAQAVEALSRLAPRSERALSAVIRALQDADPQVRQRAGDVLAAAGEPAVSQLCELLATGDAELRLAMLPVLRRMGEAALRALPLLLALLDDAHGEVRAAAVSAIESIEPQRLLTHDALFADESPEVRAACAAAFGSLGPRAEPAAAGIARLLEDESELVRHAAAIALGRIGFASVEVASGLIKALTDAEESVRRAASTALSQLRGAPHTSPHTGRRWQPPRPTPAARRQWPQPARARAA